MFRAFKEGITRRRRVQRTLDGARMIRWPDAGNDVRYILEDISVWGARLRFEEPADLPCFFLLTVPTEQINQLARWLGKTVNGSNCGLSRIEQIQARLQRRFVSQSTRNRYRHPTPSSISTMRSAIQALVWLDVTGCFNFGLRRSVKSTALGLFSGFLIRRRRRAVAMERLDRLQPPGLALFPLGLGPHNRSSSPAPGPAAHRHWRLRRGCRRARRHRERRSAGSRACAGRSR